MHSKIHIGDNEMLLRKIISCIAIAISLFATAVSADEMKMMAGAQFVNPDGDEIGSANFWQGPQGVVIYVEVSGLEPGKHAIHIHSVGSCAPNFKASKGHINVVDAMHGLLNPEGPDNGDLPNFYVAGDGTARAEMYTTRVSIVGADMQEGVAKLMDDDGAALVIHAMGDDHMAQPIGGAGGRVGCGVITGMM